MLSRTNPELNNRGSNCDNSHFLGSIRQKVHFHFFAYKLSENQKIGTMYEYNILPKKEIIVCRNRKKALRNSNLTIADAEISHPDGLVYQCSVLTAFKTNNSLCKI